MRTRSILAAVLAAMLFIAACGGDSGDPESLASEQSQDDSGDSDSGDSVDDLDLPDDLDITDIPGVDDDCAEFALAYSTVFLGGFAAMFGGEEEMAEVQAELDELGASVPAEISDEFDIVTESYNEFFEAIGDGGLLGAADVPAPEDDPEGLEAQETIDEWLADNCDGF